MKVQVYTDGGCDNNDGIGGYAAVMFVDGVLVDGVYGGNREATNNTMELGGLIAGLELLPVYTGYRCINCGVTDKACGEALCGFDATKTILRPIYVDAMILSDSQYCVLGAKDWIFGWKTNGWKTSDKKPVKNQELWKQVDLLTRQRVPSYAWVKGHSGNPGNELADQWATQAKVLTALSPAPWRLPIPGIGEPA